MKKEINNKNDDIFLFVQAVLASSLVFLVIMSLFIKEFIILLEIMIGITLIVTGINNYRRFHRKYLTIIYVIFGILLIAFTLISVINNGFHYIPNKLI